jgi:hypothetical protein
LNPESARAKAASASGATALPLNIFSVAANPEAA